MPKYELLYFPVKGRGEAIRLLLVDNGADYEEKRITKEWPEVKAKMPFGQLPCLNEGDFQLAQSTAILQYLGDECGLSGSDNKEKAKINMLHYQVQEIRENYTSMIYRNYEEGKAKFLSEDLPESLRKLEDKIGEGYIGGSKISWADYNFFDLLNALLVLSSSSCLDAFPKLKDYHARILAREGIQKRVNSEDYKNIPINANGKE